MDLDKNTDADPDVASDAATDPIATDPAGPTDPIETDPAEPTDPAVPTDPIASDTADPSETDPVDPIASDAPQPTDPAETDTANPTDPVDPADPVETDAPEVAETGDTAPTPPDTGARPSDRAASDTASGHSDLATEDPARDTASPPRAPTDTAEGTDTRTDERDSVDTASGQPSDSANRDASTDTAGGQAKTDAPPSDAGSRETGRARTDTPPSPVDSGAVASDTAESTDTGGPRAPTDAWVPTDTADGEAPSDAPGDTAAATDEGARTDNEDSSLIGAPTDTGSPPDAPSLRGDCPTRTADVVCDAPDAAVVWFGPDGRLISGPVLPAGTVGTGEVWTCVAEWPHWTASLQVQTPVDQITVFNTPVLAANQMKFVNTGTVQAELPGPIRGAFDPDAPAEAIHTPFWIMRTELTEDAWRELGFELPPEQEVAGGEGVPVRWMTAERAAHFANAMSDRDGLQRCYDLGTWADPFPFESCPTGLPFTPDCDGYRLPTEAEWRWAARAEGHHTGLYPSDDTGLPWSHTGASAERVAEYAPNNLGLFDIVGNVWEIVSDFVDGFYLARGGYFGYSDGQEIPTRGGVPPYNLAGVPGRPDETTGVRLARTARCAVTAYAPTRR